MSIMDLKKNAPKGEFLAYINKEEAALLKKRGGSGKLVNGIPSYNPNEDRASEEARDNQNTRDDNTNMQNYMEDQSNFLSDFYQGGSREGQTFITNKDRDRVFDARPELKKAADEAAQKKADEATAAREEEKRIQDILDAHRGKEPKAYSYGPKIKDYKKNYFIGPQKYSTSTKMRQLALKNLIDKRMGNKSQFNLNLFNPSMVDEDYTYNTGPTTDMMGVNLQNYSDIGKYGMTGKNLTDVDRMNRALDKGRETGKISQKEFEDAFNSQVTIDGGGDGGRGQEYLPSIPIYDEDAEEEKNFDYRFGTGQKEGLDVTLGRYFNQGGRVPRNMGGIMNVVPRQGYFLGGIGKAIKGVVGGVADAAGKVLKSDIGKMAIAGAAFYYGGGGSSMFKSGGLKGMAGNFFSKSNPLLFNKAKELSLGKLFGVSTVLPALFGEAKQDPSLMATRKDSRLIDPITGEEGTPASMRANIENAKIEADGDPVKLAALNQAYNNMLFTNAPYENYGLYANGGRIGYGLGSLVTESGVAQPASGLLMKLDRPVQPGDPIGSYYPDPSKMLTAKPMSNSGMGGMLSKLINNNSHLFKNVSGQNNNNSNNYLSTTQNVGADVRRGSYDFIDENMNGIDDREEMFMSKGGRIARAEGGLMNLGGMEKDYRAEGGFVPIGREEKADDVPARLSVNEFVFTADAVRNAGGGDIDKGAEVMENMMKNLENGGRVSEESQGNTGAQEMFSVSERIGEVI